MKLLRFPLKRKSLFMKLMLGFIAIIALLVSFNFLSFAFFQRNIHESTVRSSSLHLQNTVDRYEQHLQYIQNLAINLYFDDKINLLKGDPQPDEYLVIQQAGDMLEAMTANELLSLENMIVYYKNRSAVLDREGITEDQKMFMKYYISPLYSPGFWQSQFNEHYLMRAFPASSFFHVRSDNTSHSRGKLIPLVIKNSIQNDYYITAFIRADSLYKSFQPDGSNSFYILDRQDHTVFHAGSGTEPFNLLPSRPHDSGYIEQDDHYYFYQRGESSGLTYMHVIPIDHINSQVTRLSFLLICLLILTIAISLFISFWLASKINKPIRSIVESIQNQHAIRPSDSSISEFTTIQDNINRTIKASSLLKSYGYMVKLKNIYSNIQEVGDLLETSKPYYLVMYQLHFTDRYKELSEEEQHKAAYFIKEMVHVHLSGIFPDAVTIQTERDQILSLLFVREAFHEDIGKTLTGLKELLEWDKDYCYATIAYRTTLHQSSQFTHAYEVTARLLEHRVLTGETQMINAMNDEYHHLLLSPAQEEELATNVQQGNAEHVIAMIQRRLDKMCSKRATAYQYKQFAREVINKTMKILVSNGIEISSIVENSSPFERIKSFTLPEHYHHLFRLLLSDACHKIKEKNDGSDEPVIAFVKDYIHCHYNKDISLENIADRLNLSLSYLSNFIKDKTGENFSQILNEVRIAKAKQLLADNELKIHEISHELGYYNVNSFIRMFKKMTGLPPGEYRRMQLVKDQAL
ncbi:AraC family transcriptional regulator [Paenibacillus sp. J5C_2022]|uniref:helix-turn-helix domain-containing protein n=1 Tax=Paenibacillus sp. J5C2022 TaxID=2977129 RepID=UPI0021CE28BF|nr:AraC family transcriptional regulator [Paenibacillus sp. J5C2022]MCU6713010.1 AraC family transcriptional regulator [Paenibacillus sp. J5C2022]